MTKTPLNHTENFRAGLAKVDITPPLGTLINGDFISHYATHVHDPMHAKAVVFQQAGITLALVVVDICVMQRSFIDEIKRKVQKELAIPPAQILISSTHTHAAGSIESLLMASADLPYRQKLPDLIVESVRLAKRNLRPAKIAYGSVEVPEHMVCRRYKMKAGYLAKNPVTGGLDQIKTNPIGDEAQIDGPVANIDPQLSYIAIKGTDNEWMGLLGNYSLHYVGDFEAGDITADYFGVFSRRIQAKLNAGSDFVGLMSNGTSGEANIWDFQHPDRYPTEKFKKSELIGDSLAEKVYHSLASAEWNDNPQLSAQYEELSVAIRKPTEEELERATALVKTTTYENILPDEEGLPRIYAREQVLLAEYPDTIKFPVQALKIGNGVIGALSGEFFAETGLWLKNKVKQPHYFTISIANGYVGYVPPAHEIERGGYETWRCRSSYLGMDAESNIREKLLQLTNQL